MQQLVAKDNSKSALKPKRLFKDAYSPSLSNSSNQRPGFNPNQSYSKNINSVKCRAYKGMGHYTNECANVLRIKNETCFCCSNK